ISVEVPTVLKFRDTRRIRAAATSHAPWQSALNRDDGGHLPSLQQLSDTCFVGQSIGECRRESFPYVEVARAVIRPVVERCSVGASTLAGLLIQRMSKSETDCGGQTMRYTLCQGDLRAVIVGM